MDREKLNTIFSNLSSRELYYFYMKNFPILCVDVVFLSSTKDKTLLFKRNNKPKQGSYYTMGGNLLKDESFETAITRKTMEETGMAIDTKKLVFGGVINEIHEDSIFSEINYHGVTLYWGYILDDNYELKLDNQHGECKWFSVADSSIDPFVRERIDNVLKVLNK